MKNLRKEKQIIIAEIIFLCILTFFIAKPLFLAGSSLLDFFVLKFQNVYVGDLIIFILILVDISWLLLMRLFKFKFSICFKIAITYFLLLVNIGSFTSLLGWHLMILH